MILKWVMSVLAFVLFHISCYGNINASETEDNSLETNFIVQYDLSFNLSCQNHQHKFDNPVVADTNLYMWILPSGDFIRHGQLADSHNLVIVSEQGRQLQIRRVDDKDFGTYTCLTYNLATGQYSIIQKTINISGPYWGDLATKYRMNLIIGGVAAAVVMILMIAFCWCYNHKDADDGDKKNDNFELSLAGEVSLGCDNVQYNDDSDSVAMEIQEIKVQIQNEFNTRL